MSKTLDLRNVMRDQSGQIAAVESEDTRTYQNQTSSGTSQYVELATMDTRQKIWYFAAQQMRPVSRAEIAKSLGNKKAPWLAVHIERLVSEGWLTKTCVPHPGSAYGRYLYQASRPANAK